MKPHHDNVMMVGLHAFTKLCTMIDVMIENPSKGESQYCTWWVTLRITLVIMLKSTSPRVQW